MLHLVLRLRGGGGGHPTKTLGFAAGGKIEQVIKKDSYPTDTWHKEAVVVFNVQLLNVACFKEITGFEAPPTPSTLPHTQLPDYHSSR